MGDSFGVNLANEIPAAVRGGDSNEAFTIGGAFGRRIPVCLFDQELQLRAEVQGLSRGDVNFITGPVAPPESRYSASVEDAWTTTANLWLDVPLTEKFGLFGGGGIGGSGYDVTVVNLIPTASPLAVRGTDSTTNFTWLAGGGAYYQLSDRVTLDLGYRYVDLGNADVGLIAVNGGFPAGNYNLEMDSHEILFNIRIDLF